jgi:hypothetical protein
MYLNYNEIYNEYVSELAAFKDDLNNYQTLRAKSYADFVRSGGEITLRGSKRILDNNERLVLKLFVVRDHIAPVKIKIAPSEKYKAYKVMDNKKLPKVKRVGYKFKGYYNAKGKKVTKVGKNKKLKVKWAKGK